MPTNFSDSELKAMRLAIEASHHAAANGDGPFGATLASHARLERLTDRACSKVFSY